MVVDIGFFLFYEFINVTEMLSHLQTLRIPVDQYYN